MANRDRLNIFPSRANRVLIRNRIQSANKGHSMLKRKRDALELKLRDLVAKRNEVGENCTELFKIALFSIAKANFLDTDFKPAPIIGSDRADAFMRISYSKTIGVALPTFDAILRKPESLPLTGLSKGGKQVDVVRERYQDLLKVVVLMATFDFSIRILKDAIRTTNMRINGLEFVIIPRLVNTVAYIRDELDEMEREEFYRLKRSQQKRKPAFQKKSLEKQVDESFDWEDLLYIDASTSIDKRLIDDSVVSIYRKKQASNAAQTIITGHFPSPNEIISPTDSVLSGEIPVVIKKPYIPFDRKENTPGPSNLQTMQPQGENRKNVPQIDQDTQPDSFSFPNRKPENLSLYETAENSFDAEKGHDSSSSH